LLDREETTMRIGIDPGHGTLRQVNGSWVKDIGTAAGSLGEYEANMKIALELYPMLRAGGHDVYLSHATIDWSKKLGPNSRGQWAAGLNLDIFVSIHHDGSSSSSSSGCHGFYHNERAVKGKALATALAHAVNAEFGVGYSYGEPASTWFDKSLGVLSGGNNWAVTGAAALVELMFMSNPNEAKIIKSDGYYRRAATALYNGIMMYAGLPVTEPPEVSVPSDEPDDPVIALPPSAALTAEWQKAIELGITDGSNPQGYATREQVAAMLVRALKLAE
jgi:N-acetylmuramoyl-L-alanine amidase